MDLLRDAAVLSGGAMSAILAIVLVVRRLAGQWQPLPALTLLGAGVVLVILAQLWRMGWQANATVSGSTWHPWLGRIAPGMVLFLCAVSFSIPGTSLWALVLFWLLLVGAESFGARKYLQQRNRHEVATLSPNDGATDEEEETEQESGELLPTGVSQQFTRHISAGVETVTCLIRVPFAVGEQTHTVHVAFCPPLAGELISRCEHVDGAACETKISLVESFGARLDVKRRGPLTLEDEAVVLLEVCGAAD